MWYKTILRTTKATLDSIVLICMLEVSGTELQQCDRQPCFLHGVCQQQVWPTGISQASKSFQGLGSDWEDIAAGPYREGFSSNFSFSFHGFRLTKAVEVYRFKRSC